MTASTRKNFTIGATLPVLAVSGMLVLASATGANAWHNGHAHTGAGILGGAVVGGAIGGAVKGKKGIVPGAIIGGVVGGAAASSRPAPPPRPRAYAPPPPPQPAYQDGLVYNIQVSLSRLGYNPGPIDGIYGQRTADAISAYEYNNQLPVTGQPSPGIHNHMQETITASGG